MSTDLGERKRPARSRARSGRVTAHVAVVSRDSAPSAERAACLAAAMEDVSWSWIGAGLDRDEASQSRMGSALGIAAAVGLVAGRHRAVEVARNADVIIYLDDDVALPSGWLGKMLEPFSDPDVHIVGCRYLPDYEHMPPAWLAGLWQEYDGFRTLGELSLLDGPPLCMPCDPTLVWGLCFAVRRDTLVKLGGFHPDGYPWPLRRYRGDGETAVSLKAQVLGLTAAFQGRTHVMHRVPAERMTVAYFERRAFLQGISDSFTEIRRRGGSPRSSPNGFRESLRSIWWTAQRAIVTRAPTADGVRRLMRRAHFLGKEYHRQQVRSDPSLLEWVLRPDYFDPRLPSGWERYLSDPEGSFQ